MYSQAIAGFFCAWLVAYTGVGAFCLARRSREPSFVAFGLMVLSLAVVHGGAAWHYLTQDPMQDADALTLSTGGRIGATAFLLHFVLEYAEVPWRRRVLQGVYAVAAILAILDGVGLFFVFEEAHHAPLHLFGTTLHEVAVPVRAAGAIFSILSAAAVTTAAVVLGAAFVRGKRDGLGSFLGSVVLTVAAIHDSVHALGWGGGIALSPFGYAAFVLGVIVTLLSRYTARRDELEARTALLERRSAELAQSYDELRLAEAELVKKEQLAAVGELSAVIAHEVRNPLAVISNAVSTLRRPALPEADQETLLRILDEESSRLAHLVNELLSYARPVRIERQLVSLGDLAERALAVARARNDIAVELMEPEPVPRVAGDPGLLRQVMDNLVANALQAMSLGGQLRLTLRRAKMEGADAVELSIEDTGEGMDTLVRRRAFDPFFTTRPSGTGLGLAIVSRFVEAHGGKIDVRSASGEGTVLYVCLPVASDLALQPRRSLTSDPDRASSLPPMPALLAKAMSGGPR